MPAIRQYDVFDISWYWFRNEVIDYILPVTFKYDFLSTKLDLGCFYKHI